jgi:hypothetical protein
MKPQDRQSAGLVRQPEVDRAREAAAAEEGRVELIGPVGGADDEDAALTCDAVDLGEQLIDVTVVHLELAAGAGDCVDLVDEDDRGTVLTCPLEHLANVPL